MGKKTQHFPSLVCQLSFFLNSTFLLVEERSPLIQIFTLKMSSLVDNKLILREIDRLIEYSSEAKACKVICQWVAEGKLFYV